MANLTEVLDTYTVPGELYEKLDGGRVRCVACGHRCPIPDGAPGVCKVRFNSGGTLRVPFGYVAGAQCDPVEKKPFFHARPGALAYSFGMLGCDLHCGYCQNWVTSQALRDPKSITPALRTTPRELVEEFFFPLAYSFGMLGCDLHCGFCQNWVTSQALRDPRSITPVLRTTPRELVEEACAQGAEIVVSTYNEPLITSEWGVAVFKEAKAAGLMTAYVSNGNATPRSFGIPPALAGFV